MQSRSQLETCYLGATLDSIVARAVGRDLEFVLEHPNLWRAALRKGTTDPDFWQEFRELGRQTVDRFIECYAQLLGRPLVNDEIENVRFAFQVLRGTLNNTMMNQPGPLQLEDPEFRRQIERAFRLVAGIEATAVAASRPARRKRKSPRS